MKSSIKKMAAPVYFVGSSTSNEQGLQLQRIQEAQKKWQQSPDFSKPENKEYEAALDKDGLLVIPNFFELELYQKLKAEIQDFSQSSTVQSYPNKDGHGLDWQTGAFPNHKYPLIRKHMQQNPLIRQLVQYVTRQSLIFDPQVIYQYLNLPAGREDSTDTNGIIHADRHYPTIKVFLYTSECTVANGAFVYCRGSHQMTEDRLKNEKSLSFREALKREGKSHLIETELTVRGRQAVTSEFQNLFQQESIIGSENTLVIANVSGLHKRGTIQPGESRECLRMIYHYLYAPALYQRALNLVGLNPARYLN